MKQPSNAEILSEIKLTNEALSNLTNVLTGKKPADSNALAAETGRIVNKAKQNPSLREPVTATIAKEGTPPKPRADRSSVKPGAKGGA